MFAKFLVPAMLLVVMLSICAQDASAMYNARVGSFCSRDPIGFRGSPFGLYEYVSSNPCRYSDFSGLAANGTTECDIEGGGPSIVDIPGNSPTRPCTKRHEDVHVEQNKNLSENRSA